MSFCYWQANQPSVSCLDEDAHLPELLCKQLLGAAGKEVVRGEVTERDSQVRASVKIYFVLKDSSGYYFGFSEIHLILNNCSTFLGPKPCLLKYSSQVLTYIAFRGAVKM